MSQAKTARGGRPPVPADERLSVRIDTRVSVDEAAHIDEQTRLSGLPSRGAFVRAAVMGRRISTSAIRRADPELIAKIDRLSALCRDLGSLYNQDLKYGHTGRNAPEGWHEIPAMIADNQRKIAAFLDQLLGDS